MSTNIAQFLQQIPPMFEDGPETDALKCRFAEAFLRQIDDAYAAAKTVVPDMSRATYIATNWPDDPFVVAEMDRLSIERGAAATLPTKEEFAAKLLEQATETKSSATKLDYYKLFASVMGYVEKPTDKAPTVNVAIMNKVMRVPRERTDDEARERIASNQARLINASANA